MDDDVLPVTGDTKPLPPPREVPARPTQAASKDEDRRWTRKSTPISQEGLPEFAAGTTVDRGLFLFWPQRGEFVHLSPDQAQVVEWVMNGKIAVFPPRKKPA